MNLKNLNVCLGERKYIYDMNFIKNENLDLNLNRLGS